MPKKTTLLPEQPDQRVSRLLQDIRLHSEELYCLVEALRERVLASGPGITEEVKYGGLLYGVATPFCGVFAYTRHVSLEFSEGARLEDPHSVLEGKGKGRRHIKLTAMTDIERKFVGEYIAAAHRLAAG